MQDATERHEAETSKTQEISPGKVNTTMGEMMLSGLFAMLEKVKTLMDLCAAGLEREGGPELCILNPVGRELLERARNDFAYLATPLLPVLVERDCLQRRLTQAITTVLGWQDDRSRSLTGADLHQAIAHLRDVRTVYDELVVRLMAYRRQESVEAEDLPTDLITFSVAMDRYHVSRPALQRHVDEGDLKSYRAGKGPHKISESEVAKRWPEQERG